MTDAPEYRTQRLHWFVETGVVDGGCIGRWEETTESVEVPSKAAAEKLRDEWEATGKLQRMSWGELRPAAHGYGMFRIRSEWVDAPAQNVRVKPLEWRLDESRTAFAQKMYFADRYCIEHRLHSNDEFDLWVGQNAVKATRYPSLEAAKAAAQADYEARIRSALEPADPLDHPKVKALVEALKKLSAVPSKMIWGEDHEIKDAMREMESIADAALTALEKPNET